MKTKTKTFLCSVLLYVTSSAYAQNVPQETNVSDILKEYGTTIKSWGRETGAEAYVELTSKYRFPKEKTERIRQLLFDRETEKVTQNYIYPRNVRKRMQEKMRIDSIYRDSLYEVLIPYNRIAGEYMGLTLLTTNYQGYTKEQYTTLKDKALDIARRLYKNPRLDTGDEEIALIRKTLTDKQLTFYFDLRNAGVATEKMDQCWEKLQANGLTEELDSARDCTRAYMFYLEQQKIMDLFRDNTQIRNRHLQDLNHHKPQMIKLLDGINRSARVKEENEKNMGRDFVW